MSLEPATEKSKSSVSAFTKWIFWGCLVIFLICGIAIVTNDEDSGNSSYRGNQTSSHRGHNPDNTLTDYEFDNVPYEDLSDAEKRKANIRIGKMLEEDGHEIDGLDEYEQKFGD